MNPILDAIAQLLGKANTPIQTPNNFLGSLAGAGQNMFTDITPMVQPMSQNLGFKPAAEAMFMPAQEQDPYLLNLARGFTSGMAGSVVDALQTPASYIPLPLGQVARKLPVIDDFMRYAENKNAFEPLLNNRGMAALPDTPNPIVKSITPTEGKALGLLGAVTAGLATEAQAETLGQKNNNPINIKAFDKWEGMTGKDKYGHAIFQDQEHGIRAALKNLKNHQKKNPEQTLDQYLNTFAEQNGTKEAEFIAEHNGVTKDIKLKDLNIANILIPMALFESGTKLTLEQVAKVAGKYKLQ